MCIEFIHFLRLDHQNHVRPHGASTMKTVSGCWWFACNNNETNLKFSNIFCILVCFRSCFHVLIMNGRRTTVETEHHTMELFKRTNNNNKKSKRFPIGVGDEIYVYTLHEHQHERNDWLNDLITIAIYWIYVSRWFLLFRGHCRSRFTPNHYSRGVNS